MANSPYVTLRVYDMHRPAEGWGSFERRKYDEDQFEIQSKERYSSDRAAS